MLQPHRRVVVAVFLSACFPGLGQFYTGQWVKGILFLLAGIVLAGYLMSALNAPALQLLTFDRLPPNFNEVLALSLTLLVLVLWSIVDAAWRASRLRTLASEPPKD